MFGFPGNRKEKLHPNESPLVANLREKIEDATTDLYKASGKVRSTILVAGAEGFVEGITAENMELQSALESFKETLDAWVKLADELATELNKTPGQQLSDTLARQSVALNKAITLLQNESNQQSPELIQLHAEILKLTEDVDYLKELDVKLNNRQEEAA